MRVIHKVLSVVFVISQTTADKGGFGPFQGFVKNMTTCEDAGTDEIKFSNFKLVEKVDSKNSKNTGIPVFSYDMVNLYPINSKIQVLVDISDAKTNNKWISRRFGGFCQLMSVFVPTMYANFLEANGVKQCNIPKGTHKIERLKADIDPKFPSGPYGVYKVDIVLSMKEKNRVGCFAVVIELRKLESEHVR